MSLLEVANRECQRLRMEAKPYTAPELFPNPPIQSTQVKAALFAVEQALAQLKKQYTKVAAKTAANSAMVPCQQHNGVNPVCTVGVQKYCDENPCLLLARHQ